MSWKKERDVLAGEKRLADAPIAVILNGISVADMGAKTSGQLSV